MVLLFRIFEKTIFLLAFILLQQCLPKSKFGKPKKVITTEVVHKDPPPTDDETTNQNNTPPIETENEENTPSVPNAEVPVDTTTPTTNTNTTTTPNTSDPEQETLPPPPPPATTTVEGIPSPAYFVSPYGSDANDGQRDAPLKTIQAALQLASTTNIKNVIVREGVYIIKRQSPLLLGSAHSGITLMAYPNETPILSGGTRITGFTRIAQSQIWAATVPTSVEDLIGGITVNGNTYIQARHPNIDENASNPKATGWLLTESVILPAGSPTYQEWDFYKANTFKYRSGDLNSQLLSGERLRFVFWDKLGWASDVPELETHNATSRTIKLKTDVQFGIDNKTRYYLLGSKKALDAPGEFYHDKTNRQLLIYPRAGFNQDSAVYATSDGYYSPNLIILENARNIKIQGFTFRDQFALPYWGRDEKAGIIIRGGSNHIIKNCRFTALSEGIFMENSSGNTIQENYIHDLVADAITLNGESHNNLILANHITRFGQPNGRSHAIEVEHGANRIAYNLIEDADQYAINTGGEKAGEGILIEKNIIRNGCRLSRDCGIIYMKNGGRYVNRDIVRYNIIEKSNGMSVNSLLNIVQNDLSWGIYMDESQSGTDVYGNIIRDTVDGAIMIHKGWNNIVSNNIFIDAKNSQFRIDNVESSKQRSNQIEKNIITFNNSSSKVASFKNYSSGASIDKNFYYYRSNTSQNFFLDSIQTFGGNFRNWINQYTQDKSSIIGDPLFENFSSSNLTLRDSSPALTLGFQQIPASDIGLEAYSRKTGKVLVYPKIHVP